MKVKPVPDSLPPSDNESGRGARHSRIRREIFIAAIVWASTTIIVFGYPWREVGYDIMHWAKAKGYTRFTSVDFQNVLLAISHNLTRSTASLPTLAIDIKFKHLEKLRRKRAEALAQRHLTSARNDYVPAKIHMNGREIRVSVRLKGDRIDHLKGSKWSLRVKVKGDDHIFGMRRFSLQNPMVRDFQSESLFFESLRMAGLIAPRYRFVDVKLNGEGIGIMATEEHFSKELLAMHGRREGVIMRFDESLFWDAIFRKVDRYEAKFDDFKFATIDSFRSSKIRKSKQLAKNYATSVGLLRGFAAGKLQASDVFEPELLGRFIALADLWGAKHALFWTNLRFYLSPISLKHEIIGYDADLQQRANWPTSISRISPIFDRALEDPRVFDAYVSNLRRFGQEIINGDLIAKLRDIDNKRIKELAREFYLISPYPFDELRSRARYLLALTKDELRVKPIKPEDYPILAHAYLVEDNGKQYLELVNATSYDVEVRSIYWSSEDRSKHIDFEPERDIRFPIKLSPNSSATNPVRIPYQPPVNGKQVVLHIDTAFRFLNHVRDSTAIRYHAALDRPPLQTESIAAQAKRHRFLHVDATTKTLRVRLGVWSVKGSIHVPRGFALSVSAGATLRFAKNEGIVAFGPVHLHGTLRQPVILEGRADSGKDPSWNGIVVIDAKKASVWSHATIRNTHAVSRPDWELTGGVTFYRSDVRMTGCRFDGSTAEDALNIVNSKFTLTDVVIENTLSDGLDADFATGEVNNGLFRNIGGAGGGDALDVSGSRVAVNGTEFRNISDKALSVGERSAITAGNIVIANAATGAASKDGSRLDITGADISTASIAGLMAYIKKPEYGPASIVARDTLFRGNERDAWAQTGNTITIDNRAVTPQSIDVERLYETAMKPARKR